MTTTTDPKLYDRHGKTVPMAPGQGKDAKAGDCEFVAQLRREIDGEPAPLVKLANGKPQPRTRKCPAITFGEGFVLTMCGLLMVGMFWTLVKLIASLGW